jgi:hypothetical protein
MQNNANETDWRTVLKYEFEASEGSFVLQCRCGGRDKEAHARLFRAMIECCKSHEGQTHIERWIASGFHFLDSYMSYPCEGLEEKYFANAITNFSHLSYWLFEGEGRADDEFEPI